VNPVIAPRSGILAGGARRPILDFVHRIRGDWSPGVSAAPGGLYVQEIRFLRRDGRVVVADVSPIGIEFDGAPAIAIVARDVTERKQMQARLLLADRMASVGILAAGVGHEINNPLAYVIANLDFLAVEIPRVRKRLLETAGAGPCAARDLDEVEETVRRAERKRSWAT
jgi:signal transduction histidine kinase